jgi:hypothetical protein
VCVTIWPQPSSSLFYLKIHLFELSYDALDITVLLPPFFAGDVATGPIKAIKRTQAPFFLENSCPQTPRYSDL